jgi:hypothetical protein
MLFYLLWKQRVLHVSTVDPQCWCCVATELIIPRISLPAQHLSTQVMRAPSHQLPSHASV